jgi:hypothetical protein
MLQYDLVLVRKELLPIKNIHKQLHRLQTLQWPVSRYTEVCILASLRDCQVLYEVRLFSRQNLRDSSFLMLQAETGLRIPPISAQLWHLETALAESDVSAACL